MPYFPAPWKVTKTQELNPSLYKPLRFCEKYDIYILNSQDRLCLFCELILFESRLKALEIAD